MGYWYHDNVSCLVSLTAWDNCILTTSWIRIDDPCVCLLSEDYSNSIRIQFNTGPIRSNSIQFNKKTDYSYRSSTTGLVLEANMCWGAQNLPRPKLGLVRPDVFEWDQAAQILHHFPYFGLLPISRGLKS